MLKTVVSGLKPTGELHIGNYLGAVKQLVELQKKNLRRLYFIADYHSLTIPYSPKEKRGEIMGMAIDAMAAGLDPKKSIIFLQSHVPAHNNLAWILSTLTSTGQLNRMVEYKEKVQEGRVPNAGLFGYPILMAADVLIYDADFVPVGEDQRQHLELTRDIAQLFNKRFGKTLTEPEALHNQTPRIMSLNDPKKKMSKSIPAGCLFLSDPPDIVHRKIASAQTDSHKTIGYDPRKRPGVSNLLSIYSGISGRPINELVKKFRNSGYAEFKKALAEEIIKFLKPIQQRRKKLLQNKAGVMRTLEAGTKTANRIAEKKLADVKRAAGLI
ncbi:MAG: tryptophan--tRNA ligase [Candidatus Colwellbacteria bacterium]|nr:tryptophan--tRNA ligase [Candidatus Colwellbacteria bacterium]